MFSFSELILADFFTMSVKEVKFSKKLWEIACGSNNVVYVLFTFPLFVYQKNLSDCTGELLLEQRDLAVGSC
jgi:hypothetical protein